jgi:acetyltransferase-like isoleucine patch superfamily enzyme
MAPQKDMNSRFLEELKQNYELLRTEMREKWNRDLPLEELLFDRWERAKQLGFGEGTSIYHSSYVYGDVKVGKHTWIGPFTILDGSGGLKIGDYCSISSGVQIYTHDTVKWALSGGKAEYEKAPVRLADCCYVGPQTVIAKGLTISEHSIIGACSFINSDIPPRSIVAGVPGQIIGKVIIGKSGEIRYEYLKERKTHELL